MFFETCLNSLQNDKILGWSKCQAFADDKLIVTLKQKFFSGWVENIVGNGEKCWLPAFSPFPAMFSKASFSGSLKSGWCCKGLISFLAHLSTTCSRGAFRITRCPLCVVRQCIVNNTVNINSS